MKKVLFATTALVLSAGVAAAEVTVSGNGRMGVVYDGADWNFSSRIRAEFTMSGQTDGGLEFGGSIRADNASSGANGNAGSVYISGAFGKLSMGDVVGASEALFGDFYEVGYTDLSTNGIGGILGGGSNDIPYLTGDSHDLDADGNADITGSGNPVLLYTGTFGAFSVAASASDGNNGATAIAANAQEYAVAAAYSFGNYTIGLGYEVLDAGTAGGDFTQTELAGTAKFGNTSVKGYVGKGGKDHPIDTMAGLGVTSVFGATTIGGYVQYADMTSAGAALLGVSDVTWYGVGAEYDLGGGASIKGGIADDNISGSDPVADIGVKFSF